MLAWNAETKTARVRTDTAACLGEAEGSVRAKPDSATDAVRESKAHPRSARPIGETKCVTGKVVPVTVGAKASTSSTSVKTRLPARSRWSSSLMTRKGLRSGSPNLARHGPEYLSDGPQDFRYPVAHKVCFSAPASRHRHSKNIGIRACDPFHTIPLRNSSSGYFVPRHTIPSFHSVRNIDRSSV